MRDLREERGGMRARGTGTDIIERKEIMLSPRHGGPNAMDVSKNPRLSKHRSLSPYAVSMELNLI